MPKRALVLIDIQPVSPATESRAPRFARRYEVGTLMTLPRASGLLVLLTLLGCQRAAPVNVSV